MSDERQQRRHAERQRAKAAQADQGFAEFRAQVHRNFSEQSERDIGEAWMRKQAWEASGANGVVLYCKDPSREPQASDIRVSLAYGAVKFQAMIEPDFMREGVVEWQQILSGVKEDDLQEWTKSYIVAVLLSHEFVNTDKPAIMLTIMLITAVLWLATTVNAQMGELTGNTHQHVHCEISDIHDDKRNGHNFHLVFESIFIDD